MTSNSSVSHIRSEAEWVGLAYRMCRVPNVNAPAIQETTDIFRTKTVAHSADPLESLVLQVFDTGFYDRVYLINGVFASPFIEIESMWTIQSESVASELV
jgi:hypothetical protein